MGLEKESVGWSLIYSQIGTHSAAAKLIGHLF